MEKGINNHVDEQYINCLKYILEHGCKKNTRSGEVLSVFGLSMRFKLKEGFPVLTTKKMFTKGFVHELLWFLKGDTNIKYLVDNNVNFWSPDAYRFYNELLNRQDCIRGGEYSKDNGLRVDFDTFIEKVKAGEETLITKKKNENGNHIKLWYRYGDLGPVYGKQWRHWGNTDFDQVQNIINLLRRNPYDRRLLLTGYNPDVLNDIALPPCHTLYQFYARPLSNEERVEWCSEHFNVTELPTVLESMDSYNVPKDSLSLWFACRSQDMPLGNPANIMSASLLLSMVAQCVNMIPDEVIWNGGDCHIYTNQIEGIKEQIERDPHMYALPKLVLNPEINNINGFTYDDIKIEGYESYPKISMPLSVG
jgi:thymidylate synthase